MSSENQVTLVGNITDDPELRYTPSGAAVANFTIAVNRRFKGQDGGWEDKLEGFFRCNCWRDMAENVTESLRKGARVMVVGRLNQRSWETNEGQKRYEIEVQVDEVGPSLRWATASVQKSQRSGQQSGGGFGGGQGQQQGGGQQGGGFGGGQGQQQGGGQQGGGQPAPRPAADDWGAPSSVGNPPEGGF
jgi:single-strand DNA-binding protein